MVLFSTMFSCASTAGQSFDVKGIQLGSSLDELKAHFGDELKCGATTTDPAFRTAEANLAEQICSLKNPNSRFGAKAESFAGVPTSIYYWIHGDKVALISFAELKPDQFDSVVATMETKYGKAQIETSTVHNRLGAAFENKVATWRGSDVIVYEKLGSRLDSASRLHFYSHDCWAELERQGAAKKAAAQNDM